MQIIKSNNDDLLVLPAESGQIETVFIDGADLTPCLARIRELAADLPQDMTKTKDRKAVAALAFKVAKAKKAIEKEGLAVSKKYKELPKIIDANRRQYKDTLEAMQKEVRAPLDAWEAAEAEKKAAIAARIRDIQSIADLTANNTADEVKAAMDRIDATLIAKEDFGDQEAEALRTKEMARGKLKMMLNVALQQEAERQEAERLRKEKEAAERKTLEERVARETEERVRLEEAAARAAVERDRLAAEQRARDAEQKQRDADHLIAEATQRPAIVSQQQAPIEPTAVSVPTPPNFNRMAEVNRVARDTLMAECGLSSADAQRIIIAIAKNKVPGVSMVY